jgi:serine/threonine-protein kinase SRPK3
MHAHAATPDEIKPFDRSVPSVRINNFVCDEEPHMLSPETGYGYNPLNLGQKLHDGKYETVGKLGFGGYSSAWLASVCKYVQS